MRVYPRAVLVEYQICTSSPWGPKADALEMNESGNAVLITPSHPYTITPAPSIVACGNAMRPCPGYVIINIQRRRRRGIPRVVAKVPCMLRSVEPPGMQMPIRRMLIVIKQYKMYLMPCATTQVSLVRRQFDHLGWIQQADLPEGKAPNYYFYPSIVRHKFIDNLGDVDRMGQKV